MLLIHLARSNMQSPNLEFFNNIFEGITKEGSVETILILQHHQDRNCQLRDWNHREIPTLRFNQQAKVEVRRHFNFQSVGLVCIGKDSDLSLLDTLAEDFDRMRQERIIVWIQKKVTHEMLQRITHQAKLYEFLQVLIFEVSAEHGMILTGYRFEAYPNSQMVQLDKAFGFCKKPVDFQGRTAHVLPDKEAIIPIYTQLGANVSQPFYRMHDHVMLLFARKYNLNMKVIGSSQRDLADIQLSLQMTSSKSDMKNLNPFDLSSLKVVVPCSRERTIGDILKQLDLKCSLLYILPVYGIFVVAETFILIVTHRINGRAYQLTSLNPLLNLRAFRAILGLPFPISRRANLSLRQLSVAISVFGLIFSNFFSCKLTALLTKHSNHPQVQNFHDLRTSDLTVIGTDSFRTYIENEIDPNFFKKTITRVNWLRNAERIRLLFSLNDSYAYIIHSENWSVHDSYQKSLGRKVLCDSKDLTIIQGIPMMHVVQKNSIYAWPLSKYLVRIYETGIRRHWIDRSLYFLHKSLNATPRAEPKHMEVPLCISDLNWLWFLLGCGYGLATLVFIVELMLRGPGIRKRRSEPTAHVSQV